MPVEITIETKRHKVVISTSAPKRDGPKSMGLWFSSGIENRRTEMVRMFSVFKRSDRRFPRVNLDRFSMKHDPENEYQQAKGVAA